MATLADILDVPLPPDAGEDSYSLLPLLKGDNNPVREHAVSASISGIPSLRLGPWKLILTRGSGGWSPGGDGEPIQLYKLSSDPGETENLANNEPERVEQMRTLLEKLISGGRSTPGPVQENDVEVIRYSRN